MADTACGKEEERERHDIRGVNLMNATDELELAKRGAARLGECPGRLDLLEKIVGQPADEHTKPLYDIVIALNRDFQELKSRVDRESKKLQDEIERRQGWVR